MNIVLDNPDLFVEIFGRLPAKSLMILKLVCKKWRNLISDDFCRQHALRWPKLQPSIVLQIDDEDKKKQTLLFYLYPTIKGENVMIPYDLPLALSQYKIADACNGLWLLESVHCRSSGFTNYGPGHKNDSLYVYNPTTRGSREITLPYSSKYPHLAATTLAFDPSKSLDYKIVCIWSTTKNVSGGSYTYLVRVYDSANQNWNLRLGGLKYPRIIYGVYWNNAIYWNADEQCYICFDLCRNETESMSFPEVPGAYRNCVNEMQELNGDLYYIRTHVEEDDESEVVQLWKLSEGSDWELKQRDTLTVSDESSAKFGVDDVIVRYIGESVGDHETSDTLLIYRDEKIKAYSFRDEIVEDLIDLTSQSFYERDLVVNVVAFMFGETLAVV